MAVAPIVLLTDFGLADGYPGVMKGVIYSFCPEVPIIDLSHEVPAHNLAAAAFLLLKSHSYFPKNSIFVAVIDPGVGSARKIIHLKWRDWVFLAPDNGLLTPFLLKAEDIAQLREVTQSDLFLVKRGNTFDGRDRFAPVAAQLARGFDPEELGPVLAAPVMIPGLLPTPRFFGRKIIGQVIYVDTFGNLITTIEGSEIEKSAGSNKPYVKLNAQRIPVVSSYAAVQPGEALAVVGGFGTLEIAVNQGNAQRTLRVAEGQTVEVIVE